MLDWPSSILARVFSSREGYMNFFRSPSTAVSSEGRYRIEPFAPTCEGYYIAVNGIVASAR